MPKTVDTQQAQGPQGWIKGVTSLAAPVCYFMSIVLGIAATQVDEGLVLGVACCMQFGTGLAWWGVASTYDRAQNNKGKPIEESRWTPQLVDNFEELVGKLLPQTALLPCVLIVQATLAQVDKQLPSGLFSLFFSLLAVGSFVILLNDAPVKIRKMRRMIDIESRLATSVESPDNA